MAIAAEKEKLEAFAQEEGIVSKFFPMHREISLIADIVCLLRFILLFLKERPLVVHGNTPKASMLSMVAAWLTRRPVRIYMCHGLRYQTTQGMLRRVLMAMEWVSCHCATKVICVSNGVKDQLIIDGLCPKTKGTIILNGTAGGIDIKRFSREKTNKTISESLPKGAFVFTFIGRLVRDKGINELVHAFNRLTQEGYNVVLFLIGGQEQDLDPINEDTYNIIQTNERIIATGRLKDVRPYLANSNAFVLPSYREGVGQVLLEACCMGVPCISSDIIGCNEVVQSGVNGDLVPPRNEEMLYSKMKEWVNHPDKVKKMAESSRESIVSRYTREDVIQAYWKEYKSYLCDRCS